MNVKPLLYLYYFTLLGKGKIIDDMKACLHQYNFKQLKTILKKECSYQKKTSIYAVNFTQIITNFMNNITLNSLKNIYEILEQINAEECLCDKDQQLLAMLRFTAKKPSHTPAQKNLINIVRDWITSFACKGKKNNELSQMRLLPLPPLQNVLSLLPDHTINNAENIKPIPKQEHGKQVSISLPISDIPIGEIPQIPSPVTAVVLSDLPAVSNQVLPASLASIAQSSEQEAPSQAQFASLTSITPSSEQELPAMSTQVLPAVVLSDLPAVSNQVLPASLASITQSSEQEAPSQAQFASLTSITPSSEQELPAMSTQVLPVSLASITPSSEQELPAVPQLKSVAQPIIAPEVPESSSEITDIMQNAKLVPEAKQVPGLPYLDSAALTVQSASGKQEEVMQVDLPYRDSAALTVQSARNTQEASVQAVLPQLTSHTQDSEMQTIPQISDNSISNESIEALSPAGARLGRKVTSESDDSLNEALYRFRVSSTAPIIAINVIKKDDLEDDRSQKLQKMFGHSIYCGTAHHRFSITGNLIEWTLENARGHQYNVDILNYADIKGIIRCDNIGANTILSNSNIYNLIAFPNLTFVQNNVLCDSNFTAYIDLHALKTVGDNLLQNAKIRNTIDLRNLEIVGKNFLKDAKFSFKGEVLLKKGKAGAVYICPEKFQLLDATGKDIPGEYISYDKVIKMVSEDDKIDPILFESKNGMVKIY